MNITLCDGTVHELPMFDPVVASHVRNPASLVPTLIDQINKEKMYVQFFEAKKDLTFLDIGANVGLVSIYASPSCRRVVALEPAPETFRVLQGIALPFKQIEPWNAALAPEVGTVDFYVNDINSTASSTVNTYGTKISVTGFTLDKILDIAQLEHVDVCKIDAEGGEGDSLDFIQLKMAAPTIDSYYIETHNCPKSSWNAKMGQLIENLGKVGYSHITINGMAIVAEKP